MQLTFDGKTMRDEFPDMTIETNGKKSPFKGTGRSVDYEVLGSDEDSIAVLLKNYYGRDRIEHYHFVDRDLFWVYSEESTYPTLPDLNFREYFRRVGKR
jgi:hypothetical protein